MPVLVVTTDPDPDELSALEDGLGGAAEVVLLSSTTDPDARREVLVGAGALLCRHPGRDLSDDELAGLSDGFLLQLLSAGADHVPFDRIPDRVVVACNAGETYAEPMAEHALGMILCLAKDLRGHHEELRRGVFSQTHRNDRLAGQAALVVGYGGIGRAVARLLRAFGVAVHAINTSGETSGEVASCGTLADLEAMLPRADVVVLSLPLTRETRGLVGEAELDRMKPDAILCNLARGAIVDEEALFRHLVANPSFRAAIDVWWDEPWPFGEGPFRTTHPFLELPNVLGSPHDSALVPGVFREAHRRAGENVRLFLEGEEPRGIVDPADYAA